MRENQINIEDILADQSVDDELLEVPLNDRVFKLFFGVAIILSILVIIQLTNIGVTEGSSYKKRATQNITRIKTEGAARGEIVDRFGKVLVSNESSFNVFIVPHELPAGASGRLSIIHKLATILEIDESKILQDIKERDWRWSDRILISQNISHADLIEITSLNSDAIEIDPGFTRVHESPKKAAHIIGYTGLVNKKDLENNQALRIDDEIGRLGLESTYDRTLRGTPGKEAFFRSSSGKVEDAKVLQIPKTGETISTFIDREFQEYFYDRLGNALHELGRDIGVGIAVNPENGEVLALVNIPSFDAGDVSASLLEGNNPFFNRAISGLYNPGSTIKPLVALAALEEGIISPEKKIFSAGYLEIPNPYQKGQFTRLLDWKAHGFVDVRSALARSSNVYFYEVGGGFTDQKGLGISKLKEWWENFNLDQKTGIDLKGEESGFLPDPEWKERTRKESWKLGDTYNASIGQGDLLITPLALLNYVATIANGGRIFTPRVEKSNPVNVAKDLTSEIKDTIGEIQAGMRGAVKESYGTAHLLDGLPMTSAGKTGSAQVDNNKKVNAFFVGYAPFENPKIAILVLIENAREGSLNVVPVAYDVLNWYYENRLRKS